jgi:transcriptional regulator with XRE-family HTH domain
MSDLSHSVAKTIKRLRCIKGITRTALALDTGIDDSTISLYERGYRLPGLHSAIALSKALGCTLDELAGLTETAPCPKCEKIKEVLNA